MIKLDGHEVKVGDFLWSVSHGRGEVVDMSNDLFCICVSFKDNWEVWYTTDGVAYGVNNPRSLFWDEVAIAPPKPKQKVKKWKWAFNTFDAGHTYTGITEPMTEQEATDYCITNRYTVVGRILETEEEVWV